MPRQERGNTRERERWGDGDDEGERTLRLEHVMATRPPSSHGKLPRKCTFYAAFFLYPSAQGGDKCGATNTFVYLRPLPAISIAHDGRGWPLLCDFDVNCARTWKAPTREGIRGMPRERGENTDRVRSIERY